MHVNSHLLNKKQYSKQDHKKINFLKQKYGDKLMTLLKGNQEADLLAKKQYPIQPLPKLNPFYPKTYITHHSTPVIGSLVKYLKLAQTKKANNKWKESKRSSHSLNDSIHPVSFKDLYPKFHDHLQHLSQSLFLTKQRAFDYYLTPKPAIHPLKLQKLQSLFSTPYCNTCEPLQVENHQHLHNCQITLTIHDILYKHLQQIDNNIHPWFVHSNQQHPPTAQYGNFTQTLGNLGYIPRNLATFLQDKSSKVLTTITHTIQMFMTAKWTMIKMSHYHPSYQISELIQRSKILNTII